MPEQKSARGRTVPWDSLRSEYADTSAVTGGHLRMNARGDVLGKGGNVVVTAEQMLKDWEKKQRDDMLGIAKMKKQVSITNPSTGKDSKLIPVGPQRPFHMQIAGPNPYQQKQNVQNSTPESQDIPRQSTKELVYDEDEINGKVDESELEE